VYTYETVPNTPKLKTPQMQDEASEYSASVAESHVTNPELRATASDYVAGILK